MERKPEKLTIINEPVEKLAKDLVEFLKKNYGQSHVGYAYLDYNVRRVFWKEKGVDIPVQQDGSPESKLLRDQILRAEFIAREIMNVELDYSQLLKGKNEKELVAELIAFTEESCAGSEITDMTLRKVFQKFWLEKYPDIVSQGQLSELRRTVMESARYKVILNALIKWAKNKKIAKFRKDHVKIFLWENVIHMGWEDTNALYCAAKEQLT